MIILLISLLLLFFGISLTVISHGVQMYGLLLIWFGLLVFAGGWRLKKARWRMHTCLALAAATVLGIILLDIPIIRGAKTDTAPGADYVIILGAAVYGTQPSPSLRDRLDAALDYLQDNPEAMVVTSGGQGPDEAISEAEAMKVYLMNHGIAEDRILTEDQSVNTKQNLSFSFSIIEEAEQRRAAAGGSPRALEDLSIGVVSSEYHLFRIRYLAGKLGKPVTGIAAPTSYAVIKYNYFIREIPAMVKAILLD